MDTLKATLHYLLHLEWTVKTQHECKFCDESNFKNIVYQDNVVIVVQNNRSAGEAHWLIMPRNTHSRHVRDIEALTEADIPLLQAMDNVKKELLQAHFPNVKPADLHCGYHRGRRQFIGSIIFPDIVSIHHLHLHVIVRPRPFIRFFKYLFWLSFMWVSDATVLRRTRHRKVPRMNMSS